LAPATSSSQYFQRTSLLVWGCKITSFSFTNIFLIKLFLLPFKKAFNERLSFEGAKVKTFLLNQQVFMKKIKDFLY